MADFQAKIQAVLDTSKLSTQISKIGNSTPIKISKFKIDKSTLNSQIQSALNNASFTLKIGKVDLGNLGASIGNVGGNIGRTMADRIRNQLDNGGIEASIAKVTAQYERLGATGSSRLGNIKSQIESLNRLQAEMGKNAGNPDALVSSYNSFCDTLVRVKNGLATVSAESKTFASSLQIGTLDNKMSQWLSQNSNAAKDYGASIENLRNRLAALGSSGTATASNLKQIENEFRQIQIEAIAAGKAGQSFGSQIKGALQQLKGFVSAVSLIRLGIKLFKDMSREVLSVDTAMTGLRRVTKLSADQYRQMYSEMIASAKEYGATLTDIINGTTTWVKLGFDPQASQQLANITTMYQHVTDLDTKTAVDNLVTAYKGFQEELLTLTNGDSAKAVEYIADIFDKLGNEFAVSAADVGAGLVNSASALNVAGNSIQQSAAMITGVTEVTQNAQRAGNALRTMSMRLRGTTAEELEGLGEDTEGLIEVTSKLQKKIKDLTGVDITDTNGELRSTFNIMRDIADVWDTLNTNTQANLLETLAGKTRASDVAALLRNWDSVEKAYEASINAAGTASQEQAKYMQSLQGHIDIYKASWQSFANTFVSSDFLKGMVDTGTVLLNILDSVTSKLDAFPTLIGAITAALYAVKGVGELINQFQYQIVLWIEYAPKAFTNGNMNEITL